MLILFYLEFYISDMNLETEEAFVISKDLKFLWKEMFGKKEMFGLPLLDGFKVFCIKLQVAILRAIPCKNRPVNFRRKMKFFHFLYRS